MGSKAEKRHAKKAAKEELRKAKIPAQAVNPPTQKEARSQVEPSAEKEARSDIEPSAEKEARSSEAPEKLTQMRPEWIFGRICGCFPGEWTMATWNAQVQPKLDNFRTMTWGHLETIRTGNGRYRMHHDMEVDVIVSHARGIGKGVGANIPAKLAEIGFGEPDVLFRFRLAGRQRLWGIKDRQYFTIIWYDPEHEIYPVEKR